MTAISCLVLVRGTKYLRNEWQKRITKILALLDFYACFKNLWGQVLYDNVKGCKSFPAASLRNLSDD